MTELARYRIPPRDETVVTLYADCSVEITQTSAVGGQSQPVRIDSWDLPELIELLDCVRRYDEEDEPPLPRPLKSVAVETAKKKGPPAAG